MKWTSSVPLAAVIDRAILVYRQELEPLSTRQDGPVRLFITAVESCDVAELNACTNVRNLDPIRLTVAPETKEEGIRRLGGVLTPAWHASAFPPGQDGERMALSQSVVAAVQNANRQAAWRAMPGR